MANIRAFLIGALAVVGFANPSLAVIPGTATKADVYKVTIQKMELCRTSACSDPFVIADFTSEFDIASVGAGASVGSYVSLEGIPRLQTWSYVRVTISTTIKIQGTWTDGQNDTCRTVTNANANQVSGATQVMAESRIASGAGALGEHNMIIPDVGFSTVTQSDYDGFYLTKANGAATATILFPLETPYTCKGDLPRIEVQFGTQSAMGYVDGTTGGGVADCQAYPRPPTVRITVTDP